MGGQRNAAAGNRSAFTLSQKRPFLGPGVDFEQAAELTEEGDATTLSVGDAIAIPLGSSGTLQNGGETPVSLLSVVVMP